ncbi:lysylphosphatidylglycerol synthase transmembrane domain-containing protein [Adlercreutzia caecimuris]|uniref:lysylphosphatidylglycerol synthase transmembrane domain-containing protein n=1 Tax=Adlercreutzia caecimuris TaxID=671266 RepID=UPI00249528F9|nr:lysylphosphatidylglycerol synthase transmembrane domain-containing protein [Adlercreutzia caecimuris]
MRGNLQKIMIGIVVVIVLAFILFSGDSLVKLVDTIKQGTPAFIIAAVAAQVGKYLAQGRGFQACFNTVNGHISYGTGLSLVFGTFFMNTVAPSMNLAGTSLVMATATKNGMQAGKGTTAALLMQLSIDTGFVIIMLVTFGALSFTVGLQPGWLAVGAVAIALVGGLVFMITVGGLKPNLVLKVLHPFVKLADKVLAHFKKPPVDDAVTRTIHNFSDAAHLITKNPRKTVQSFLWTTLSSVCEMGCFVLVGFAFGVHHPEALICGYVVATLFAMISFVPQGVGVVEAAVTVAFALFGVDSATGLAVVMVYRGIVFWLPFLVGAFVIQRMRAFVPSKKKIEGAMAQDLNSAVSGQAAALEEASEAFAAEPAGISTTSMEVEPAAVAGKPAAVAGKPATVAGEPAAAATASREAESSVAADAPKEGTRSAKAPELAK